LRRRGTDRRPAIKELRGRQQRNLFASLLLSQGVPMIAAGDEIGRTQQGNNNAYCQDNEISWLDWDLDEADQALLAFARRMIALRRAHPVFRRRQFMQGRRLRGSGVKDLAWFRPDGQEMSDEDWGTYVRCFGMRLAGDAIDEVDDAGGRIVDGTFLVLLNAHHETIDFVLPGAPARQRWEVVADTRTAGEPEAEPIKGGQSFTLEARSLAVFELAGQARVTFKEEG